MTVYKVVKPVGDSYSSGIVPKPYSKEYKIGIPTKADNGSSLFAFEDRTTAHIFAKWHYYPVYLRVFKAEAVPGEEIQVKQLHYNPDCICNGISDRPASRIPRGTVFCKSITLLEEEDYPIYLEGI